MAKMNFSNVQQQTFEPLPEGMYDVKVTDITTKQTQAGNDMFVYEMTVQNGEFANRKLWLNCPINDNPFMFFNLIVAATGMDEEKVKSLEEFDENSLVGKFVCVKVIRGMYNDKPKNEIKAIEPSSLEKGNGKSGGLV